jgi:Sec-independent protein secretion pathway component TatC
MKLARMVLIAAAGRSHAECVTGDLEEEFVAICASRGISAGNRWYASQVIRSVIPLSGLWLRSAALHAICVAAPMILVDRLWRFVYSQIPLKDASVRDTAPYLVSMALIAALGCCVVWRKAR